MTTQPTITHTHVWDGTRDLPDWLHDRHHWHDDQLVIHTPDQYARPEPGWLIVHWTDDTVTVASPTVADRVYGPNGLAGQLAALQQVARGYCPACGRGDASPTTAQWYAERQRADHAEGQLRHLQATSEAAGILLTRTTDERDQLRAAIARVRALAARIRQGAPWTANHDDLTDRILAALEPVGPATTQTTEPAGWLHAGTRDLSIPNPPSEDTP